MLIRSLLLADTGSNLLTEDGEFLLIEWKTVVFPVSTPTLANTLLTHHRPISRITLLSSDLTTALAVLTPLEGSVTWERTRDTQRTASFTVAGADLSLLIGERPVLIERGVYTGLVAQLAALVTGRITEVTTSLASGAVSVTVESRLSLLNRSFPLQTTFPVAMRLRDIGRAIAESAGYGFDDSLYDLGDSGIALAVARTFDVGDNMLASLIAIFADSGLDVWDTGAGVLTSGPTPDLTSTPIAWAFAPNALVLSHSTKRSAQQAAVNRVRVTGRGPDGYPIFGEVKITDPSHPLYWTAALDLPMFVDRPEVSTAEACVAVATQLLIDGSSVTEAHAVGAVPIPPIMAEGRPIVSDGADRLRLDSLTMPLRHGAMSFSAQTVKAIA